MGQVCTRCVQGRYSPVGAKSFDCPVGGECKVSAKKLGLSTSDSLFVGSATVKVLPGYWKSKMAKSLRVITEKGKGYCDWDPNVCRDNRELREKYPECVHGMCELNERNECSDKVISKYNPTRLYNCLVGDWIHQCPLDETSCKGSLHHDENTNDTSVCNTGYEGVKCDVCQLGYYKMADKSCGKCLGNVEESIPVYIAGGIGSFIYFLIILAIYLRDDSGAFLVKSCASSKNKSTKVHAVSKSNAQLESISENAD